MLRMIRVSTSKARPKSAAAWTEPSARTIVDEHNLEIETGLHGQRGVERGQMLQTVVVDDDDAGDVHDAQFYTIGPGLHAAADVGDWHSSC